jgi:hypothetical protein
VGRERELVQLTRALEDAAGSGAFSTCVRNKISTALIPPCIDPGGPLASPVPDSASEPGEESDGTYI